MISDDGTVVILFNGEIYNTDELKDKYLPHQEMNSGSDTELLLHLYQSIGIQNLVLEADGMFAIVIYDSRERSFVIARDRFGIKPIYYSRTNRGLAIASEIKPLIHSGLVNAEPDLDALGELALFRYVADPNTPFKNISLIPPGSIAYVHDDSSLKIESYWSPSYGGASSSTENTSQAEAAELLKETIDSSIRAQFVSDVPVGLELSGGIDSSLLAWSAEGSGLEGFSAIPASEAISEERYIDHVCSTTSTTSHKVTFDPEAIGRTIGEVAYYHETPINHEGSIGVFLLSKYAKERGTTVLLSGEGADELFGGYLRHQTFSKNMSQARTVDKYLAGFSALLPRRFKTARDIWINRDRYLTLMTAFGTPTLASSILPGIDVEQSIARRAIHRRGFEWEDFDNSHLIYDQRTYLIDLLTRQDKMSMANSVETRVPFLGNKVADLALSLPISQKLGPNREGKILLKNLVAERFGHDHAFRRKVGFPVPFSFMSASSQILQMAKKLSLRLGQDGLANPNSKIFESAAGGDGYAIRSGWILLSIGLWFDIYFRNGEITRQFTDLPTRQ